MDALGELTETTQPQGAPHRLVGGLYGYLTTRPATAAGFHAR